MLINDKDILTYIGNSRLGDKEEDIQFKATIKDFSTYKDVKTTLISRPFFKKQKD